MAERKAPISWLAVLGLRLFAIVPGPTTLVIAISLVSQIALILAFLLPLKIVMLMGSGRVPRYFPSFLRDIEQNDLVMMLSIGTIGLYLLHLLANMVHDRLSALGAERVASTNRKLSMFSNQDKLLRRTYERFARMCSGSLFAALALGVLILIYPTLAIFVAAATTIVLTAVVTSLLLSPQLRDRYEANRGKVNGAVGNVLFLSAFGMLVQQFLTGALPNGLIAILSLILARQMFSRLGTAINDGIVLINQRLRIDALFFADQILLPKVPKQLKQYWSLLDEDRLKHWPKELLSDLLGETVEPRIISWLETGEPGSQGLVFATGDHDRPQHYMVKLYGDRHGQRCLNEREVLNALPVGTPLLPTFVGGGDALGFACNVYRWDDPISPSGKTLKTLEADCLPKLWSIGPPPAVVDVYCRTHMILTDRINDILPTRLRQVARLRGDGDMIEAFEECQASIRATLEALPLVFVNPDIRSSLLRRPDGRPVVMSWGRWSIEPVGAGWEMDGDERVAELALALAAAARSRPHLAEVDPNEARLAAALFALCRHIERERYESALDMVGKINRGLLAKTLRAG